MQRLLMHISRQINLDTLKPLTFENGEFMLCATDNYAFALMMFAKVNKKHPEGNFHCNLRENGILYVDEKWENAFFEVFSNQQATLYYVDDKDSVFNPAVPQYEFYCEKKVVKSEKIYDIYELLNKQIEKGNLVLNRYKDRS